MFSRLFSKQLISLVFISITLNMNNAVFAHNTYSKIDTSLFGKITEKQGELSAVREFYQDNDGVLWLLDNNFLFRFDGYEFNRIDFLPSNKLYQLTDFAFDQMGNIWISSADAGLFKYNIKSKEKRHLFTKADADNSPVINNAFDILLDGDFIYVATHEKIYKVHTKNNSFTAFSFPEKNLSASYIFLDKQGKLWLGTNNGLYHIENNSLVKYPIDNKQFNQSKIANILQTEENTFWITTAFSGAWILNKNSNKITELSKPEKTKTLNKIIVVNKHIWLQTGDNGIEVRDLDSGDFIKRIQHDSSIKHTLTTNQVTSLYKSSDDIVWVGTRSNVINFYKNPNQAFHYARPTPSKQNAISYPRIRGIGQLEDNTLLLSSLAAAEIDVISPTQGKYSEITLTALHKGKQRHLIANQFYQDSKDTMWVITFPAFLVHYNFTTRDADYYPAPLLKQRNGAILNIVKDPKQEKLWLAMSEGLLVFDLKSKTFSRPDFNFNGPLYTIAADSQGNIWTGNKSGLYWFEAITQTWHHLANDKSTQSTLSNNQVSAVFVDSNDQLWVGSQFQLFKKVAINNHQVVFEEVFLKNLNEQIQLTNIIEDNQNRIWIDRHAFFDPTNYQTTEISKLAPFDASSFNTVLLKSNQGELLFAGYDGLNFINPEAISSPISKPNLLITTVTVDDKPITMNDSFFTIPSNSKNTSIHFTGIELTRAEQLSYQYRIIGYNEKWRDTEDNSRFINFTSLPPGDYSVDIKVTNHLANSQVKSVDIKVLARFYQTLWFKLLSLLFLALLIWLFIKWRVEKQAKVERKHNEMKLAAEQAENIAKLASDRATMMDEVLQKKNQLLADVSHELRTPLTVLQIEIETLQHDFSDDVQASYKALRKKVSDMNNLIDDISELAKSDIGALTFNFSRIQIKPLSLKFTQELKRFVIANNFQWSSNIVIDEKLSMSIDKVKIKQLLINLINNSIKYTDADGKIALSITQCETDLCITVSDSAPSVAPENLEKIFERLYRVEASRSRATGGSGLGLSICKSIVNAHHGDIIAQQSPLGGLSIVIKLPMA